MKQLQMCALVSQFGLTMGAKNTESAPSCRSRRSGVSQSGPLHGVVSSGFLSHSHLGMRAHINTDTISLNAESCLQNLSGNSLLEGFVPIQLLDEMLGHFCSLLHASRCQTRVCGQVKVLSR